MSQSSGLHYPTITWGKNAPIPSVSSHNLASAPTGFSYSDKQIKAYGQNCYARAYYSLNKTLDTFGIL